MKMPFSIVATFRNIAHPRRAPSGGCGMVQWANSEEEAVAQFRAQHAAQPHPIEFVDTCRAIRITIGNVTSLHGGWDIAKRLLNPQYGAMSDLINSGHPQADEIAAILHEVATRLEVAREKFENPK